MPPDPSTGMVSLLATLFMIPVFGLAIVWVIHKMVSGDVSPTAGFGILFLLLLMLAIAILVPGQKMMIPVLVIVVVGAVFFPFAETQLEKQGLVEIEDSRIDKAHRELAVRPNNYAARFELARALYERGLHGHAICLAENTINAIPSEPDPMTNATLRDKFHYEESMLRKWKKNVTDKRAFEPVQCPSCKHKNPPGVLACEKCKGPYLLELVRVRDGSRTILPRLLAGFGLTGLLLLVCAWISTALTWPGSAIGILGAMVSIGGLLNWIYRPRTLRK